MSVSRIVPGSVSRWLVGVGAIAAVLLLTAWRAAPAPASRPVAAPGGAAPGAPGATSYLDAARKDCFGTARNTTSKVWFTVADGVLSDVFSPTIENTNVHTLQYIVTDGHTFTDSAAARYDLSGELSRSQRHGLPGDEQRPRARLSPDQRLHHRPGAGQRRRAHEVGPDRRDARAIRHLKVYVRYDATIDNTGGGGKNNGGPNNAIVDPATTALVSSDTTRAERSVLGPGRRRARGRTAPSCTSPAASSAPPATA